VPWAHGAAQSSGGARTGGLSQESEGLPVLRAALKDCALQECTAAAAISATSSSARAFLAERAMSIQSIVTV
jgi:hypothetical protein